MNIISLRAHSKLLPFSMVDANFTTLGMSIVVLEGLGRQLDPELDLFSVALPMLASAATARALRRGS